MVECHIRSASSTGCWMRCWQSSLLSSWSGLDRWARRPLPRAVLLQSSASTFPRKPVPFGPILMRC